VMKIMHIRRWSVYLLFGSLSSVHPLSSSVPRSSAIGSETLGESDSIEFNGGTVEDVTMTKKKCVIIGAGWGGLSAAHAMSKSDEWDVTVIDSSPRPGGLVRDGFLTKNGTRVAEAGQHGFWDCYSNIFSLLYDDLKLNADDIFAEYAEQGQYSPRGLEAIWPVYRNQQQLPTGLGQALYTRFLRLSPLDLATALPLVLAFSEFDDSDAAWEKYDNISFRDLCVKLGVSRRCYQEVFESMILTGLFAPGKECSAAAALGMAYFFVLRSQNAFDVRWCKGNVGETIFEPWCELMKTQGVKFIPNTRVVGFNEKKGKISGIQCINVESGDENIFDSDSVVFAVGAKALSLFTKNSPELAKHAEFREFANLRGTSVLATRIYLDRHVKTEFSANACWGFEEGVGMTMFDIRKLHGDNAQASVGAPGSVLEVDFYYANSMLVLDDESIVTKVKSHLDKICGDGCKQAKVIDAAIVRIPEGVNWYYPGSYSKMPSVKSGAYSNVFFAGDIVKTRHGSWSQEKAFVTGVEAANTILHRPNGSGIIPLPDDELHVSAGRNALNLFKTLLGGGKSENAPSFVDFLW